MIIMFDTNSKDIFDFCWLGVPMQFDKLQAEIPYSFEVVFLVSWRYRNNRGLCKFLSFRTTFKIKLSRIQHFPPDPIFIPDLLF